MYVISEKFEDFNGTERTEDFYFNLTTAELTKLQLSEEGGLMEMLKTLISKKDISKMIKIFETIIDASYGEKSPDGRKFIKNEEILNDFKATNAYSQIFIRFATDEAFTAEFINNVVPKDLASKLEEAKKEDNKVIDISSK